MTRLADGYSSEQRTLILKHLEDTIAVLRDQTAKLDTSRRG